MNLELLWFLPLIITYVFFWVLTLKEIQSIFSVIFIALNLTLVIFLFTSIGIKKLEAKETTMTAGVEKNEINICVELLKKHNYLK